MANRTKKRTLSRRRSIIAVIGLAVTLLALGYAPARWRRMTGPVAVSRRPAPTRAAARIVAAAKEQIGDTYDAAYIRIPYPNGDVHKGHSACTDVVIRSLRAAGFDLQRLIHEDMERDFAAYPIIWRAKGTDTNIDHRRVPNLMRFMERHGQVLTTETSSLVEWQPGDIVCWRLPSGQTHTGIISDGVSQDGLPLVIDNAGTCEEEDALNRWTIIGHYRYPPPSESLSSE